MKLFRRRRAERTRALDEAYVGLREQALRLNPEQLGLSADEVPVLALLMEMPHLEAVATLVGVADGSTSLYFSNGGGMIGAGEHAQVAETTHAWLRVGRELLDELTPIASAPDPPAAGVTQFVAVTPAGLRVATAPDTMLESRRHPLSPLFAAGHDVITQIRLVDES